jgi:predicted enzyme related to lactoylglutathione lyase
MLNFRVDDLDALLARLRAAGVTVESKIEENADGRFAWIMDPDGTRVELWEPPASEVEVAKLCR